MMPWPAQPVMDRESASSDDPAEAAKAAPPAESRTSFERRRGGGRRSSVDGRRSGDDGRRPRRGASSLDFVRATLAGSNRVFARTQDENRAAEDEELRAAGIEAHQRWRSGKDKSLKPHRQALMRAEGPEKGSRGDVRQIDVKKLKVAEQKLLTERAMGTQDPNAQPFLKRLHERMDRVGIRHSSVEVRFQGLDVETDVFVGSRALPSVTNAFIDYAQKPLNMLGLKFSGKRRFPILKDMSGVLKPGRFTLLLGPPGSGKSSLLKALSGKLDMAGLRMKGDITYNGHSLDEFVVQRTSSYIEQRDVHIAELTVRETLDFAARTQGVGHKRQELKTLMEREAEQGIVPDPEIDAFMKAEAQAGVRHNVITELMLRLLGLDYAADTLVGNEMVRGISGGQKKRVTTGEMIVGPKKTLFMDEISTGLDSSTTCQIVETIGNFCHMRDATVLMALLQPAPEVYNLFDDILLLSEGQVVYHGPKEEVLLFFEGMGFQLPERKGIADFLQEVTSRKDQAQYWAKGPESYSFVPVTDFAQHFQRTQTAERTRNALEMPFDRAASPEGSLITSKYGLPPQKALRATLRREILLVKRNSFIYVFRFCQVVLNAIMTSTLFFRTTRRPNSIQEANYYLGVLFFSLISMLFNNWAEFQLQVDRLPSFYKQRDNRFYPAWAFALPTVLLSIPQAIVESCVWASIVYWVVGLQPSAGGYFTFWLFNFLMHLFATALFRLVGAFCQTSGLANATSVVVTLFLLINGGFVLARERVRWWWRWVFYCNPLAYAQRSVALNEFRASRWAKPGPLPGTQIGTLLLSQRGFENKEVWIWGGAAFMIGAIVVLHAAIILCLTFLPSPDKPGSGSLPEEEVESKQAAAEGKEAELNGAAGPAIESVKVDENAKALGKGSGSQGVQPGAALADKPACNGDVAIDMDGSRKGANDQQNGHRSKGANDGNEAGAAEAAETKKHTGSGSSTIPFEQLWLTFQHVWYSVDLPGGMDPPANPTDEPGGKSRLYLLKDVSGAFRPGVLTALIGETGAGKTTLMDVLAGRKTKGQIEGEIRVKGHLKEQSTFARVSGYVEQNDIHSPATTVQEALLFSASLRLPGNLSKAKVRAFVDEIMDVVELTPLKGALVGLPGSSGLSVEQRKRLTIAVELVANPSIVFMDEPTSGLDARAAAIVMRAVRNTVDTGRTVVCTIHQPSIDIFETFNELLLMKRGGRIIFHGPLGLHSSNLIKYFQSIEGVDKIEEGHNPATWALEVTNQTSERRIGQDFADVYQGSGISRRTDKLVEELSVPPEDSQPLRFDTKYSRNYGQQFLNCLWKNKCSYWRSPEYNSIRFLFTALLAFIFGTSFWGVGNDRGTQDGVLSIVGALFSANMFLGVYNSSSVQPVISVERSVYYREKAAGYYAAFPFTLAQVCIELPYILVQSTFFTVLVYAMIKFEWTATKFFWFLLFETMSLVLFTMYGITSIALTPNIVVASIISGTTYFIFALFCGFIIQAPAIPGWWIWLYYLDPVSWTLYGTVTSQLGDVTNQSLMAADGSMVVVADFITDYFGYHHNLLGVCVAVLAGMICLLFVGTAFSYQRLRFEQR